MIVEEKPIEMARELKVKTSSFKKEFLQASEDRSRSENWKDFGSSVMGRGGPLTTHRKGEFQGRSGVGE